MVDLMTFDPGWSTGWSAWEINRRRIVPIAQGTVEGGVEGFVGAGMRGCGGARMVVYEDFIVEPSYVGRAWSSEVIGAIKTARSVSPVSAQLRSDKSTLFTQKHTGDKGETERFAWLRERGFSGTPHELDAITHALVYLKRQRNRAALKQYWGI